MTQFDQRNITMVMDLYEMTMAYGYFNDKDKDTKVVLIVYRRIRQRRIRNDSREQL